MHAYTNIIHTISMLFIFSNNTKTAHLCQINNQAIRLELPKQTQSGLFENTPNNLIAQFQFLGLKNHGHTGPKHSNHLYGSWPKTKPSRRKLLPLGGCQNSPILVSMRSSSCEDKLSLLLRLKLPIRSSKNLERRLSFSLYNSLFLFSFMCFLPSPIPPVDPRWVKWDVISFHMLSPYWFPWISLSIYPSTLDLHPILW